MKKVFLLFIFININVFAQEYKITKQLDWMLVKNQVGLLGFVDSKGKEIVPCKYTMIDRFREIDPYGENKENWARVKDERGFTGFINLKGMEIVPCKYSSIGLFSEVKKNWARVTNDQGLIGFINLKGKEIVPCKYTIAEIFEH